MCFNISSTFMSLLIRKLSLNCDEDSFSSACMMENPWPDLDEILLVPSEHFICSSFSSFEQLSSGPIGEL